MLHPVHHAMLKKLEQSLRDGDLTPTNEVGPGTFVCFTQTTPAGLYYHQGEIDATMPHLAKALYGTRVGEKIGEFKIVAVYDVWPVMEKRNKPPVQVFDN
jgi:hypothetical protein